MMEIWRDIPDYLGIYQVSNLGRIKRIKKYKSEPTILKSKKDNTGYLRVDLSKDCKRKSFLIHRLVALAFIPNPSGLPQINHKNENKADNRVENLEWCDSRYNNNYGTAKKRISISKSTPIIQCNMNGEIIRKYYGMNEAARQTGIYVQNIHKCCIGVYKTAGGYKWKYAL